jgi:hypothetical protein
VEGFDELAEEKGVAVIFCADGCAGSELIESFVQDVDGLRDESLALLVDILCGMYVSGVTEIERCWRWSYE